MLKPLCPLFLLLIAIGCGKPEPRGITLYCSSSHLPLAQQWAETFEKVYGVVVVCLPTDGAISAVEPEIDDSKKKDPFETKRNDLLDSENVKNLKKWVHNAPNKDFSQYLLDNRIGDLYLCDSQAEVQRLTEDGFALKTRTIAFVTPVLIVQPDKAGTLRSLDDILKSTGKLGVVEKDVGGLGREAERFLTPENSGRIVVYDDETHLLQAFQERKINAALCWDSTATKRFPQTERISLPRVETLAVPLTLCDLASGTDYQIMEMFGTFLLSEKGRQLCDRFGYKTK